MRTQGERERTFLLSLSWRWTLLTAASREATQRCFSLKLVVIRYRYLRRNRLTVWIHRFLSTFWVFYNHSDVEYISVENGTQFKLNVSSQPMIDKPNYSENASVPLKLTHPRWNSCLPNKYLCPSLDPSVWIINFQHTVVKHLNCAETTQQVLD